MEYPFHTIEKMEEIAISVYSERVKAILGFFLEYYRDYFSTTLNSSLSKTSSFYFPCSYKLDTVYKRWKLKHKKIKGFLCCYIRIKTI